MSTYYITILMVTLFTGMAQYLDHPRPSGRNGLQVHHSLLTGLLFFSAVSVLVFVSGFRYRVGTDYVAYYSRYMTYVREFRDALRKLDEPGYPLIANLATIIHNDGATAIFLASLFTIWPAMKVIYRNTDQLLLAVLLYIFLGCWHGGFNGVRQYLAATMLLLGYEALENRKLLKYAVYVFLAFLFHRSAIVMIALYFAVYRKINIKNLIILISAVIIILSAYDRILYFAGWITETEYTFNDVYASRVVNILRVLASCAPALVFYILLWNTHKDEQTVFYLNLLIIHAAFCIATMNSALLYRISIYTTLFQIISIPELLKRIQPSSRRVITLVMIPLYAFFWWYDVYGSLSLNHFQWIWQRYSFLA